MQSPPSAKVDVLVPESASLRTVAILSDVYMQDLELADRLRESFRHECARRGYDVKDTENEAAIVIVPSLAAETGTPAVPGASRPARRRPRLFDTSSGSLSAAGTLRVSNDSSPSTSRLALVVAAYRTEDWLDPQFIDAPMPKVWRIVAVTPRHEGEEKKQLSDLIAAGGRGLDQLAPNP